MFDKNIENKLFTLLVLCKRLYLNASANVVADAEITK